MPSGALVKIGAAVGIHETYLPFYAVNANTMQLLYFAFVGERRESVNHASRETCLGEYERAIGARS